MSDQLIPLSHLSLEGLGTAKELARRYADVCLVDDLGRVCVDRPTAAAAIGEHAAREARTRDRQRQRRERLQAQHAASVDTLHETLRARADRDRELIRGDETLSAYEVMAGADHIQRMERKGQMFDEMIAGISSGAIFRSGKD